MTTDTNAIARREEGGALATEADAETAAALTHYLGTGDLSRLTGPQKAALYTRTCESLGINSLTRPFEWIEFYDPETKGKKLVMYPKSACADQIAYQHRIRVQVLEEKIVGSLFKVEMKGTMPNGRTETNVAYLDLTDRDGNQLKGQRLGNAFMKAHTKAKRRLVFGMVGMMAPPDVEDLQRVRVVTVDGSGNVIDAPTAEQKALADDPRMARAIGEPVFEDTPIAAAPIPETPDQRPRREDLEHPKREGPRPTFKASDEEIEAFRRAWFAAVKGLSLDSDDARHRFVAAWTADEWPKAKRTESLTTMRARMTASEADEFLAHVRALMEDERQELLAQSHENMPDPAPEPRRRSSQRVHDAVVLTGGTPLDGADDEGETPVEAF